MKVIVIPAYQPDERLGLLVNELAQHDLGILVVDDGSGPDYRTLFETVAKDAVVIYSEENEGKGAALKKGFSVIRNNFPDCEWVITADADGQHSVSDILRVADQCSGNLRYLITSRDIIKEMPLKSKMGNILSRIVYTILNKHYYKDNQSGLRAFSMNELEVMLSAGGDAYDYELNALCYADKTGIPTKTLPIETVYFDGNAKTHFNAFKDTMKIYLQLFKTTWPALTGALIALLSAVAFTFLWQYTKTYYSIAAAGVIAGAACVLLYRFVVFRRLGYKDMIREGVFWIFSTLIIWGLTVLLGFFVPKIPMFCSFLIAAAVTGVIKYFALLGIYALAGKLNK